MSKKLRAMLHLTLLFLSLVWSGQSDAAPEDRESLAIKTATASVTLLGAALSVDLYWPDAAGGPWPSLVVGHGFARGKGNFVEWGKVLASHGYVVAIPGFPGVDHPRNGRLISALLDWLQAASAKSGDRLAGLVDGERRGAVGHSAGGLAVLLAAAKDPSIDVVVALDPVDANNNALTAAGSMKAPLTAIFAQPGACNGNGNARAILSKLAAPHLALSVVGGTHCDAEDPSDFLCALCGGAAAPRGIGRIKRVWAQGAG